MKYVLLALAIISQAYAGTPTITSKKVTCSQLQDFIRENGEAFVRGTFFKTFVSLNANCSGRLQYVAPAVFKTRDNRQCYAGETCKYEDLSDCRGENYCGNGSGYGSGYSGGNSGEFDNYTTPSGPGYYGN